ncbi:MAG: zinc-dependent metalloprotease [Oligoflexia bacterium]|nr:zinc-dependent metalloprotease [Oligoflexia bacterium]
MRRKLVWRNLNTLLLVLTAFALFSSCAKERPIQMSEQQQRDLLSVQDIKNNSSFEVSKFSPVMSESAATPGALVSLLNERPIDKVVISDEEVPAIFKLAFKGLTIENPPKEKMAFKISLRKDNKLMAYKVVASEDYGRLSLIEKSLAQKSSDGSYQVKLFYYDINYFRLVEQKDDNGVKNGKYDQVAASLDNAEYVGINFSSATRKLVEGLGYQDQRGLIAIENIKNNSNFEAETERSGSADGMIQFKESSLPPLYAQGLKGVAFYGRAGEKVKISLQLENDKHLIAYKEVSKSDYDKLSDFEKSLAKVKGDKYFIEIFRYEIKPQKLEITRDADGLDGVTLQKNDCKLEEALVIALDFAATNPSLPGQIERDPELRSKEKDVDIESVYAYLPSTHGTPRKIIGLDPFFQGELRLVKLKFTKDFLEVYEIERDKRFSSNEMNYRPILSIPIEHKDYRCKKDKVGYCSGEEEEDVQKRWQDKRYFIPNFKEVQFREVNTLDVLAVKNPRCFSDVATKVSRTAELYRGGINFEIEKTYKLSDPSACMFSETYDGFKEELEQSSFNMRYFYSLVRYEDLTSKDYQEVIYPAFDQEKFGFFKVSETKKDENLEDHLIGSTIEKLGRWNPNKKEIVFQLSPDYYKSENKIFLDALYKSVQAINRSLAEAEAGLQIKIHKLDDPSKASAIAAGDLRYNVFVLIDDPLVAGLLGYGPTVRDPLTGEILKGQVNVYTAPMIQSARTTYIKIAELDQKKRNGSDSVVSPESITVVPVVSSFKGKRSSVNREISSDKQNIDYEKINLKTKEMSGKFDKLFENHFDKERKTLGMVSKKEKLMDEIAKNNMYSSEHLDRLQVNSPMIDEVKKIEGVVDSDGKMKSWYSFDAGLKRKVTEVIASRLFMQTFIHEMGHNLGLRHNFLGGMDQDNFYTEIELKEHAPTSSSIMAYAFSSLNELTLMGKYDIAALKYAYARKVDYVSTDLEQTNKEIRQVQLKQEETLAGIEEKQRGQKFKLKRYEYCTDEHVGYDVFCDRFIEGVDYEQLVDHFIADYYQSYRYHFKNRVEKMTADAHSGIFSATYQRFSKIRNVYYTYSIFSAVFGDLQQLAEAKCKQANDNECRRAKSMEGAGRKAISFFAEMFKMPDHYCLIDKSGTGNAKNEDLAQVPLAQIYNEIVNRGEGHSQYSLDEQVNLNKRMPQSCFDPVIVAYVEGAADPLVRAKKIKIRAEMGMLMNDVFDHSKSRDGNSSVPLLAAGTWPDRFLAALTLGARIESQLQYGHVGSSGMQGLNDNDSYMSMLRDFYDYIILDKDYKKNMHAYDEAGKKVVVSMPVEKRMWIDSRVPQWMENYFFIPWGTGSFDLYKQLLRYVITLSKYTNTKKDPAIDKFVEQFKVYTAENSHADNIVGAEYTFQNPINKKYYAAFKGRNSYAEELLTTLLGLDAYKKDVFTLNVNRNYAKWGVRRVADIEKFLEGLSKNTSNDPLVVKEQNQQADKLKEEKLQIETKIKTDREGINKDLEKSSELMTLVYGIRKQFPELYAPIKSLNIPRDGGEEKYKTFLKIMQIFNVDSNVLEDVLAHHRASGEVLKFPYKTVMLFMNDKQKAEVEHYNEQARRLLLNEGGVELVERLYFLRDLLSKGVSANFSKEEYARLVSLDVVPDYVKVSVDFIKALIALKQQKHDVESANIAKEIEQKVRKTLDYLRGDNSELAQSIIRNYENARNQYTKLGCDLFLMSAPVASVPLDHLPALVNDGGEIYSVINVNGQPDLKKLNKLEQADPLSKLNYSNSKQHLNNKQCASIALNGGHSMMDDKTNELAEIKKIIDKCQLDYFNKEITFDNKTGKKKDLIKEYFGFVNYEAIDKLENGVLIQEIKKGNKEIVDSRKKLDLDNAQAVADWKQKKTDWKKEKDRLEKLRGAMLIIVDDLLYSVKGCYLENGLLKVAGKYNSSKKLQEINKKIFDLVTTLPTIESVKAGNPIPDETLITLRERELELNNRVDMVMAKISELTQAEVEKMADATAGVSIPTAAATSVVINADDLSVDEFLVDSGINGGMNGTNKASLSIFLSEFSLNAIGPSEEVEMALKLRNPRHLTTYLALDKEYHNANGKRLVDLVNEIYPGVKNDNYADKESDINAYKWELLVYPLFALDQGYIGFMIGEESDQLYMYKKLHALQYLIEASEL